MGKFLDLSGHKYHRLTVLRRALVQPGGNIVFICLCECGRTINVTGDKLRSGNTKSCGCLKHDVLTTHGESKHPLYMVWYNMVRRCADQTDIGWKNYGGRGIKVCSEWTGENGLVNFITDMPPRPFGKSLERKDNNGPYSKENCYWATRAEQSRNMRTNRFIEYAGLRMCVPDWAAKASINPDTLWQRLKSGWSMERALIPPKTKSSGSKK